MEKNKDILHRCVQKVATGPGYSKSLSLEDMRDAVLTILDGNADPVRAAVFFIGLRMKRESMDENKGALQALLDTTEQVTADVDTVIEIAEPYDGYLRGLSLTAFLPAVLAEMGEPAYSHGVESVGPKFGLTHHRVLKSLGIDVNISTAEAASRLADPAIGWAYVDQSQFSPKLFALSELRERMIKRSVMTTVEVLNKPISGRNESHFVTGYVHSAYPPVYAELARYAGYDSAMLVRGIEGGITPSLQQSGKYYAYHNRGEEQLVEIEPSDPGIQANKRTIPLPPEVITQSADGEKSVDVAKACDAAAQLGIEVLQGKQGLAYDSLLFTAAAVLKHRGRFDTLPAAAEALRPVMDSGAVIERLKNAGATL